MQTYVIHLENKKDDITNEFKNYDDALNYLSKEFDKSPKDYFYSDNNGHFYACSIAQFDDVKDEFVKEYIFKSLEQLNNNEPIVNTDI